VFHLCHLFLTLALFPLLFSQPSLKLIMTSSWAPVAHACNPSYSGGRDQENRSSKPAWANSLQDPILKEPITNIALVEWLQGEGLSSIPSTEKKKLIMISVFSMQDWKPKIK
jgi:hypothetical protein